MKTMLAKPMLAFPLWFALTISAAAGQSVVKQHNAPAPQCTPSKGDGMKSSGDEPVAIVEGQSIDARDLDNLVASQILPVRDQEYQIKRKGLEDLIRQRLVEAEAKKWGLTTDQLYAQKVDSKIATPSDDEVAAYYLGLKSQMKTPPPLGQIKMELQANLKTIETRQARQDYADSLRATADVTVLLKQPRVEVGFDAARLRGEPNAVRNPGQSERDSGVKPNRIPGDSEHYSGLKANSVPARSRTVFGESRNGVRLEPE